MSRLIILDTETTGFSPPWPSNDRIVSICCLEMINSRLTGKKFSRLVDPQRSIPASASKVHGIYTSTVKNASTFSQIADQLLAFIGSSKIVAHNAAFDRRFVNFELNQHGRRQLLENQWICSMKVAKQVLKPKFKFSWSLDSLCQVFCINNSQRNIHGAEIDTKLLAQVWVCLNADEENFLIDKELFDAMDLKCKDRRRSVKSKKKTGVIEEEKKVGKETSTIETIVID